MKTFIIFITIIFTGYTFAMKVYQDSDFTGKVITNISTAFSVTGVFDYVPEASFTEPVPYWQMTNTIDTAINPITSIVSGECDTNRVDILFSTNFTINSVYVFQYSTVPQMIFLFTNSVQFDSFSFSSGSSSHSFAVNVGMYDRLGISSSNIATVVDFCFQGRRE